jgi:hypothetical protein
MAGGLCGSGRLEYRIGLSRLLGKRWESGISWACPARASLVDAPAIAHVLAEALAAFQPLYTPGGFAATTPSAEVIAQRFSQGRCE